ncbi:MAG: STAS domain-containing protein [Solirubrobacterales bacterium]|nr:STAS domain-containing protein [Solirubrobacterales bacterium]
MNRPDPISVAVRISPGRAALIVVSGELDLAGVPVFAAAVRNLELASIPRAVLDLRRVVFIDAVGLHAVLDLHAACLEVATALQIVPGPRNVQRIFELTGTDRRLPFAEGDRAGEAASPAYQPMEARDRAFDKAALRWVSRQAKSDAKERE